MSGNKSNPLANSRITGTRVKKEGKTLHSQKNEEDCPSTKRVSVHYRTDSFGEYNYWLPKMLE